MGPQSGGLCDVDLDCVEAVQLAPHFLPATGAVFGRSSRPRSHHLYKVTDPEPITVIEHHDENNGMIVELRVGAKKGAQTVFPGSQHESGEPIEWASDGEPLLVPYVKLARVVRGIAFASLLLRHWPKGTGNRHELARRVGGFLARADYKEEDIGRLVEIVAHEAGDDEVKDRCKAASDAAAGLAKGEHVYGLPKLQESMGEKVANALAKIIGYNERPLPARITATPFEWVEPSKIPPRQWLYTPHYIRQFVSATFSPGGLGKTSLLTVEALAMAANKKLLGIQPAQKLRVWYWNGEDPMQELRRRFAAACKYYGLTKDDIGGHLFIDSGRTMPIVIAEDTRFKASREG
jgi:AAA domain/Bifunctional DNA primase/polymerase, N-terminal